METLLDSELVVEEQTEEPIPCRGYAHARGIYGHVPEQYATWTVVFPCGCVVQVCDGVVQESRNPIWRFIQCNEGHRSKMSDVLFVPIA